MLSWSLRRANAQLSVTVMFTCTWRILSSKGGSAATLRPATVRGVLHMDDSPDAINNESSW
jgi:hypothetical protein